MIDELLKKRDSLISQKKEHKERINNDWGRCRELEKRNYDISIRIYELDEKLKCCLSPVKTDGVIDLRKGLSQDHYYSIFLHDQDVRIGEIEYRSYHCSEILGDVGYSIKSQYINHGYAYRALCLLSEQLFEEGIPDFWISTYTSNRPSLRIIEKYGGKKLNPTDNLIDSIALFVCQTRKRKQVVDIPCDTDTKKREELKALYDKLNAESDRIAIEIDNLYSEIRNGRTIESNFEQQIETINEQIAFLSPPVKSSSMIDLKYLSGGEEYYIFEHDSQKVLGKISNSGGEDCNVTLSLSTTCPSDRRIDLIYETLSLFSEKLHDDGIANFYTTVPYSDIDLKTAMIGLGGKVIKSSYSEVEIQCPTSVRNKNTIGTSKK